MGNREALADCEPELELHSGSQSEVGPMVQPTFQIMARTPQSMDGAANGSG